MLVVPHCSSCMYNLEKDTRFMVDDLTEVKRDLDNIYIRQVGLKSKVSHGMVIVRLRTIQGPRDQPRDIPYGKPRSVYTLLYVEYRAASTAIGGGV